jgi:hypothetical protein
MEDWSNTNKNIERLIYFDTLLKFKPYSTCFKWAVGEKEIGKTTS